MLERLAHRILVRADHRISSRDQRGEEGHGPGLDVRRGPVRLRTAGMLRGEIADDAVQQRVGFLRRPAQFGETILEPNERGPF